MSGPSEAVALWEPPGTLVLRAPHAYVMASFQGILFAMHWTPYSNDTLYWRLSHLIDALVSAMRNFLAVKSQLFRLFVTPRNWACEFVGHSRANALFPGSNTSIRREKVKEDAVLGLQPNEGLAFALAARSILGPCST